MAYGIRRLFIQFVFQISGVKNHLRLPRFLNIFRVCSVLVSNQWRQISPPVTMVLNHLPCLFISCFEIRGVIHLWLLWFLTISRVCSVRVLKSLVSIPPPITTVLKYFPCLFSSCFKSVASNITCVYYGS